jgi:hypothetical protein
MQIRLLLGPDQPLPAIVPIAQCRLGRSQPGQRRLRQTVQLGVSFDAIAHSLDQQAQTMAVVGRIVQRLVEFLPLLGQAPDDALAQALEQILTLGGPQEARKGIENYQQLASSGLAATAG